MYRAILRAGLLLALTPSASPAETESPFAAGTDPSGRAQAVSDAAGRVMIESPEFPRGVWVHLADEAGQALAGIQVEYQGRPDSLVALRCVDPSGLLQETLLWARPEGDPLRLAMRPGDPVDLPAGLAAIDWRIDRSVERLSESDRLVGWEAVAAFLRRSWSGQGGVVAVRLDDSALTVDMDQAEAVETLMEHLRRTDHLPKTPTFRAAVYPGSNLLPSSGVVLQTEWFEDENLEAAVRDALFLPDGRMTRQKIASVRSLRADKRNIHSLAGVGQLTGLEWLGLFSNRIVDVGPLASLTRLESLGLNFNEVVDVRPLAALTNLEALYVQGNEIVDVSALAALPRLKTLALGKGRMGDVSSVGLLISLEVLWMDSNEIGDVSPLAALTNLQHLGLEDNEIVDTSPLATLTNLNWLGLGGNQIQDIGPLVANPGLGEGDTIHLSGNPLSEEAINEQIPALEARGVDVRY